MEKNAYKITNLKEYNAFNRKYGAELDKLSTNQQYTYFDITKIAKDVLKFSQNSTVVSDRE